MVKTEKPQQLVQFTDDNEIVIAADDIESAQAEGKRLRLTFTNGETTILAIDDDDSANPLHDETMVVQDGNVAKNVVVVEEVANSEAGDGNGKESSSGAAAGISTLISAAESLQDSNADGKKRRRKDGDTRPAKKKAYEDNEEEPDDYNTEDETGNTTMEVTVLPTSEIYTETYQQKDRRVLKSFPCELCSFSVASRADLARHLDSQHNGAVNKEGEMVQHCDNCGRMFVTLDELIVHGYMCLMQRVPGKMNRFKCPNCQYEIEKQRSAEHHYQRSHATHKRACPDCKEELPVVEYYLEHRMLKHGVDVEMLGFTVYHCPHCNFSTTRHQFKRRHSKKCRPEKPYIHRSLDSPKKAGDRRTDKKNLKKTPVSKQKSDSEADNPRNWKMKSEQCSHCSEILNGHAAMLKHVLNQHPETMVHCELCDQPFLNPVDLLVHDKRCKAVQVPNSAMFGCPSCDYKTYKARKIAEHYRIRHSDEMINCVYCTFKCKYMLNMMQHLVTEHNVLLKDKKIYQCDQCNYRTVRVEHFKKHTDEHGGIDRRVNCSVCFKTFATNATLEAHVKNVHIRVKSFQCPRCEFCSHSAASLRNHLYTAHKVVPERADGMYDQVYKCAHCDYSHIYERIVCRHISLKHSNQEQFTCKICDASFKNKSQLDDHHTTHDERIEVESPLSQCQVCGFTTSSDEVLADHFANKHANMTQIVLDPSDEAVKKMDSIDLEGVTIIASDQVEENEVAENQIVVVDVAEMG